MIVSRQEGNILATKIQTITCPVNTVGVMGKGLALTMRRSIPGLDRYYRDLCHTGKLKTGTVAVYPIPKTNRQVLLFPTKQHWRDPSDVLWVEQGLEYLVEHLASLNITELGMIPLGCGLGQLDFTLDVEPLLMQYLDPLEDLPVHLYFG